MDGKGSPPETTGSCLVRKLSGVTNSSVFPVVSSSGYFIVSEHLSHYGLNVFATPQLFSLFDFPEDCTQSGSSLSTDGVC